MKGNILKYRVTPLYRITLENSQQRLIQAISQQHQTTELLSIKVILAELFVFKATFLALQYINYSFIGD